MLLKTGKISTKDTYARMDQYLIDFLNTNCFILKPFLCLSKQN
jgi:hypothetical protein